MRDLPLALATPLPLRGPARRQYAELLRPIEAPLTDAELRAIDAKLAAWWNQDDRFDVIDQ